MTAKTDEQERETFESAWASVGPPGADAESLKELRRGNGYANKHPILQGAWQGWKLARAALQSQHREDSARLDWLESCEEAHGFCHTGYGEYRYYAHQTKGLPSVREAIDHARRVEGEGE